MKRLVSLIAAFLIGGVAASVGWGIYSFNKQTEFVTAVMSSHEGKARMGELILNYIDEPDRGKATRLNLIATNMVSGFLNGIDMCEEQYPYLHTKRRYSSEYQHYQRFLLERNSSATTPAY